MKTQEQKVYSILAWREKARTEEIKIAAMRRGVSCGDRYIRWMSERGIIENIGKAKDGDKTDTWVIKKPYTSKAEPVKPGGDLFSMARY